MIVSKKKWEELNERVRKLEAKMSEEPLESSVIETFEYGRTTVKRLLRKMATHMYKEETASRGNGKQPQKD